MFIARILVIVCSCLLAPAAPAAGQDPGAGDRADPLVVGVLAVDGVYNSELVAPIDIFHHTVFHTDPGMRVVLVGRTMDPVTSFEGQRIAVDHDLDSAPPLDVLVVPSAEHSMDRDLEDRRLIRWVAERGRAARSIVSICDGAFLLAEAGLLDGRRCTTFPGDIPALRARYPKLTVVEGVRFVADGKAVTGVGGARSYAPALYVVERLYGPKVAHGVGEGMVLDWDLERVRHLAMPDDGSTPRCYLPGQRVDPSVSVEDAQGDAVTLGELRQRHPGAEAFVLVVIAGGEAAPAARRGGFWCEDSFNEIANLRHLRLAYADRNVAFVGVFCPPVHHEAQFGYDPDAFARPEDDPVYRTNRRRFVESTLALRERDMLPFDEVLFDPRFRLLGAPPPGDADAPAWQGRFKWFADTQTYGTPTIWVLDRELGVPGPPFSMNVYESPGRKLRYTPRDVGRLIERTLLTTR